MTAVESRARFMHTDRSDLMKFGITFRLTALALALVLMGALIAIVTITSQHQAEEAKGRLGQVDVESFRIADLFKEKLRLANDSMRRYASVRDSAAWEDFLKASEGLQSWIDSQSPNLVTARERGLLKQMETAREAYLQKARDVRQTMEATQEAGASLAEYNGFQDQARHFYDLGQELARAHYESRNAVLAQANETFSQLRVSVLTLVSL